MSSKFKDLVEEEKREREEKPYCDDVVFAPLPLSANVETPRDRRSGNALVVVMVAITCWGGVWFFTDKQFKDITGFNFFSRACIYSVVGAFVIYFILTKFIFKINKQVEERSVSGTSNKSLALSEVWNISSGGVTETEFFREVQGVILNYQGCPALIYRTIMRSTDGLGVGADKVHYDCNQCILDYIMEAGYTRLKINMKYDTCNDPIWEYTADRIYSVADEVTGEYVGYMNDILKYQYEYTKEFSRVSNSYYVIKMKHDTTVREVINLYNAIVSMSKQGSLHNVKLVDISEFQSILQRYYGFQYIDLENVMPKTTLKNTLGDSKVIRSSSNIAGNWLNSKQPTETVLVQGFYDNPYVEVVDIGEDITNNIPELDIFKD